MRTNLYLKTQAELLSDVKTRMLDTGNALATDALYYTAINDAIYNWSGHVAIPHIYEFNFTSGTYDYALPSYVRPPFAVQIKSTIVGPWGLEIDGDGLSSTYVDVAAYSIEPDGSGGFVLRMHTYPYAAEGRIIWYADNGPVPTTVATLTSSVNTTDTSLVLTVSGAPDIGTSGYVKVESEVISYHGLTRTSTTSYTLTNCVRAQYGTVAASHNSAVSVYVCVAADDMRLWPQLYDQVAANIHEMQLHKSTAEDSIRHQQAVSYYRQKASQFWKTAGYVTQRRPRFVLNRGTLGPRVL